MWPRGMDSLRDREKWRFSASKLMNFRAAQITGNFFSGKEIRVDTLFMLYIPKPT